MLKVYIGNLQKNIPYLDFLQPNFFEQDKVVEEIRSQFNEPDLFAGSEKFFEITVDPGAADYFLLPHSFNKVLENISYIQDFQEAARKYGKKIIVFVLGDFSETVHIDNSIVFRMSRYRSDILPNEIIMPAYAQDIGRIYGSAIREKNSRDHDKELPIVGFCGWAYVESRVTQFKLFMKKFLSSEARIPGIVLRKRIIDILKKSSKVATNFVLRTSYSGNSKTISVDPIQARKEYVDVLRNSEYCLAPKGDGNFSVRFFEILSMGRIPVVPDTEIVLPLEKSIEYKKFVLKVPLDAVSRIDSYIADFDAAVSPDEFIAMQRAAKNAFDQHLFIRVFLKNAFTRQFLDSIELSQQ